MGKVQCSVGHQLVPLVVLAAARQPLFFHVGDRTIDGHFTIPSDETPAVELGKAEQAKQRHTTPSHME